jgi:hypothetical protein
VSAADDAFVPGCTINVTGFPEPIRGVEAWKQAAAGFLAAFPDMQLTVDEHVVSGDTAFYKMARDGNAHRPDRPAPRDRQARRVLALR